MNAKKLWSRVAAGWLVTLLLAPQATRAQGRMWDGPRRCSPCSVRSRWAAPSRHGTMPGFAPDALQRSWASAPAVITVATFNTDWFADTFDAAWRNGTNSALPSDTAAALQAAPIAAPGKVLNFRRADQR